MVSTKPRWLQILICLLGYHDWKYDGVIQYATDEISHTKHRDVQRCAHEDCRLVRFL